MTTPSIWLAYDLQAVTPSPLDIEVEFKPAVSE
jgi:hypothetical protein